MALAVLAALCVVLVAWVLSGAREWARRDQCARNLSAIACACFMYADVPANEGRYPSKWSEMFRHYIMDGRVLTCPSRGSRPLAEDEVDSKADYVLVPGLATSSPAKWILMYDRYPHMGAVVNIVRVNRTVTETITVSELHRQLQEQGAGGVEDSR
ncbi:MAG: hypothetical protein NTW87_02145 [Planctomycetota bacterium]|nr:hypothetical protein [Planctomycetota bacterium]